MTSVDVAVVGAGPAGLMTAAVAARRGYSVVLIDAAAARESHAPTGEFGLRVVALSPASRRLFEAVGAWPPGLLGRAQPYREMQVYDGLGERRIEFDSAELRLPELGHIVEVDALVHALESALPASVERVAGVALKALTVGGERAELTLADGRRLGARLVAGCDGAQSKVRKRSGVPVAVHAYRQTGVVANFDVEPAHGAVARQVFTADGALGLLPLANGQVSIVWSVSDARARELLSAPDADLSAAVCAAAQPAFRQMTLSGSARAGFPLRLQNAGRYAADRTVLIGDAAHVVHPLAGLGLNLGLGDIAWLDQAWAAGADPGGSGLLREYDVHRRGEVDLAVAMIDGLERLYATHSGELAAVRSHGLEWVNRMAPLKRAFMRHAVGMAAAG